MRVGVALPFGLFVDRLMPYRAENGERAAQTAAERRLAVEAAGPLRQLANALAGGGAVGLLLRVRLFRLEHGGPMRGERIDEQHNVAAQFGLPLCRLEHQTAQPQRLGWRGLGEGACADDHIRLRDSSPP